MFFFDKKKFYWSISLIKILLGLGTMLLTYYNINIYEDPTIAIGLGFTGFFIFSWGLVFFIIWGVLFLINDERSDSLRLQKDSYKSSLLSGLFLIVNILLIFLEQWTKPLGIIILAIFVLLHIILFSSKTNAN